MALRAANVSNAGKHSQFLGLPELRKKIKGMQSIIVEEQVRDLVAMIAAMLRKSAAASAQSKNVPSDVLKNIFSTAAQPPKRSYKVTALTGLRKRGNKRPYAWGYREWKVAGAYTRIRWKGSKKKPVMVRGTEMQAGGKVGENLGTMWELGTSHPWMPARPWFRPAMESMRQTAMSLLAGGYRRIIEDYAKRNA